jgi:sensor histidine kinase YesM
MVLVVSIAAVLHFWLGMGRGYVFNLAVAVMIAISMRLGSLWQESEEARLAAEAAKADAELSNLRYQTNPHFLLNTLNNIYALTAFDTRRAQEAIQQLSGMLRHILYDNQEKEVEMKDEVNFLQNYVNLMKIRLPGTVDVTFDTQHVYPRAKIVPLILIPLIENAFKHGVSPTQPSFIHTTLKADESCIDFLIENSNHPKLANDQSGHGIGLELVQRRLDLAYPGHYQWDHGPRKDGTVYYSHIIIE